MIVIVDYGMGNLGSILNMLKKVGSKAIITTKADDIWAAEKIILPGVGAFDTGIKNLEALNLLDVLNEKVLKKKTLTLGVCLGMQLLTRRSTEGILPGLGWIQGETIHFQFDPKEAHLKIPHMGWNTISIQKNHPLVAGLDDESRFYFVHTYHVVCEQPEDILLTTHYEYPFASGVQHGNVMGTQFHPEKSHRFGMQLFRNFVEMPIHA
jgi:imidazole glycerol-phosphate synthase subunit HisH